MQFEHVYVLGLALATILLLAFEKAHISILGVGLVLAVAIPAIIPASHAVAGFANPAVVTIAALYIVAEGFLRTGAASILADRILARTGGRESTVVFLVMVMAGILSAFINNTMVVVTFLPVVTSICQHTGLLPSRLLIPLSFASILGGMCTLVGTSTNLLVSGVLMDHQGLEPLGMFDMTGPGLVMACVGLLFIGLVGRHLLPRIPSLTSQLGGSGTREYVTEILVGEGSPLLGRRLDDVRKDPKVAAARPLMLVRDEALIWPPFRDLTVQTGDILMVSGRIQDLADMHKTGMTGAEESYDPATMSFFELALTPTSDLVGMKLGDVALKRRYGAVVVAVQRAGKHIRERLAKTTLRSGDVLLAFGGDRSKALLRQTHDFNLIEGVDDSIFHRERAPVALGVAGIVIALFVSGLVHPVIAALTGAMLMIGTGCLNVRQAHNAVNWPILVFIGGALALSKALEASGATTFMADALLAVAGDLGPHAILAAIMISAVVLTELLSNNAVAVILTPVAITTAEHAGLDYRPLVLAVALGASTSFANPIGYQTNLIILGPGGYRFRDYLRIGLPMDVLVTATGVVLLPVFWPLK